MEETLQHPWLVAVAGEMRKDVEAKQAKLRAAGDAPPAARPGEEMQTIVTRDGDTKGLLSPFPPLLATRCLPSPLSLPPAVTPLPSPCHLLPPLPPLPAICCLSSPPQIVLIHPRTHASRFAAPRRCLSATPRQMPTSRAPIPPRIICCSTPLPPHAIQPHTPPCLVIWQTGLLRIVLVVPFSEHGRAAMGVCALCSGADCMLRL